MGKLTMDVLKGGANTNSKSSHYSSDQDFQILHLLDFRPERKFRSHMAIPKYTF